jgi:chaperonin GroEL
LAKLARGVAVIRVGDATEVEVKERKDRVDESRSAPARQIAINAGEDGSLVVGKISENDSYGYGFDAQEGEYGDLVSKGIIDPDQGGPHSPAGRGFDCRTADDD